MKRTLIVVDMQNDFVSGSLGSKEAKNIVPNVVKKVKEYLNNSDRVIFTQDTHSKLGYERTTEGKHLPVIHCVRDTWGWEIIDELKSFIKEKGVSIIMKTRFGLAPYQARELVEYESNEYELIGLCTDICVISNALILKSHADIEVSVDPKCCAGSSIDAHNAALVTMKSCHINIL